MTDSTYNDLIDHAVIARSRTMHNEAITRLNVAEAGVTAAQAAHAAADAAANRAAAGDGDLSALDAEHTLADAAVVLASATRVRDAALARHARTHKNLGASEAMAWRPVAVAAGRARLAACEKFTRGRLLQEEAAVEFNAADKHSQHVRARGVPQAESAGQVRELAQEQARWNAIKHALDVDAGTFGGLPNGFITQS